MISPRNLKRLFIFHGKSVRNFSKENLNHRLQKTEMLSFKNESSCRIVYFSYGITGYFSL